METKKTTTTKLDIKEIEQFVKLLEAQRDLAYHLHQYNEVLRKRKEELELITLKAQKVNQLKSIFKKGSKKLWLTLTEEEVKQVNNMLQQRHIKI